MLMPRSSARHRVIDALLRRAALCTAFLALCGADTPHYTLPPVATADPNVSDIEQMEQVIKNLGDRLRLDNWDTTFIPNPALSVFRVMNSVGLIVQPSDVDPKRKAIGTGTLLNPCWVLTSYHVVEGRDMIEGGKAPRPNRRVDFLLPISRMGEPQGKFTAFEGRVVDPGILKINADDTPFDNHGTRNWADDFVLVKMIHRMPINYPVVLGTMDGIPLPRAYPPIVTGAITISVGYSGQRYQALHVLDLQADFCRMISNNRKYGIATDCEIQRGMSGGPLFLAMTDASGAYSLRLVAVNIQPSSGVEELFRKDSGDLSAVAPLTDEKIAKINAIIAKQDCPA